MCLAIPSKVVEVDEKTKTLVVETFGVRRRVSALQLPEPVKVGDFVLVHVGFAIEKIDEEEAKKSLELFEQMFGEELREELGGEKG